MLAVSCDIAPCGWPVTCMPLFTIPIGGLWEGKAQDVHRASPHTFSHGPPQLILPHCHPSVLSRGPCHLGPIKELCKCRLLDPYHVCLPHTCSRPPTPGPRVEPGHEVWRQLPVGGGNFPRRPQRDSFELRLCPEDPLKSSSFKQALNV